MSYNLFALNPTSIVYSCYQDEDLTWRPMWFLIESVIELTDTDGIFKNEGKIINAELARNIGYKLKDLLNSGEIDDYISRHTEKIKNCEASNSVTVEFKFDKELIKEFSNFCINSQGFKIL